MDQKVESVPSPREHRPSSDSIRKECGGVQPSNTTSSLARLACACMQQAQKRLEEAFFFCLCMPPSCTGAHPILQSAVKIEGLPPSRVGSTMFGLAVARGANETPPKCVGDAGCGRSSLQSRSSSGPLKRQKCLVLVTALAALNSGVNPRIQKTAVSGCGARGECHCGRR